MITTMNYVDIIQMRMYNKVRENFLYVFEELFNTLNDTIFLSVRQHRYD
jgi:hypothetical protein